MKLVIQPDNYPITFIIWGGQKSFNDFFKCLIEHGVSAEAIHGCLDDLSTDAHVDQTAAFQCNFGNVQAAWVSDRLTWKALPTYCHEIDHMVWDAIEYLGLEGKEVNAYMTDYIIGKLVETKAR